MMNFSVPFGNLSSTASSNFTSSVSGSGNSSSNDEDLLVSQKPTYLQALLGDNPPIPGNFEHASLGTFSSQLQQTNEVLTGLLSSRDSTDCLGESLQKMCSISPLSYTTSSQR